MISILAQGKVVVKGDAAVGEPDAGTTAHTSVPNSPCRRGTDVAHSLWESTTIHFIRHGKFGDTLRIAEVLLDDPHDLIHKAVGWMLREVGKRDQETLETFLRRHHRTMPRTMLRYATGHFPEEKRHG